MALPNVSPTPATVPPFLWLPTLAPRDRCTPLQTYFITITTKGIHPHCQKSLPPGFARRQKAVHPSPTQTGLAFCSARAACELRFACSFAPSSLQGRPGLRKTYCSARYYVGRQAGGSATWACSGFAPSRRALANTNPFTVTGVV